MKYKLTGVRYLGVALAIAAVPLLTTSNDDASATVPYISERVSTNSSGTQVADQGAGRTSISGDGRFVAFESPSTQLVTGDTNSRDDVFVKDRQIGTVTRANTNASGNQMAAGILSNGNVTISNNGRFVGFLASNNPGLVSGSVGNYRNAYIKDTHTGAIEIVSLTSTGTFSTGSVDGLSISANGRFVTFSSNGSDLVSGDTNAKYDVFVRDRLLGTTTIVTNTYLGTPSNNDSLPASISCDGAYIAFSSVANNLVANDTNSGADVFLVDRVTNTIKDITITGNNSSGSFSSGSPQLSCDGSTIVFHSDASNLVANDTNASTDMFAYDIYDGSFERINVTSSGSQAASYVSDTPNTVKRVSYDGNLIVFESYDTAALVPGDTNGADDVFLRNRKAGTTEIISKRNSTTQTSSDSQTSSISADGRFVVYQSNDSGLTSGDTNALRDIFVSKTGL
jgi:hypothetical protein